MKEEFPLNERNKEQPCHFRTGFFISNEIVPRKNNFVTKKDHASWNIGYLTSVGRWLNFRLHGGVSFCTKLVVILSYFTINRSTLSSMCTHFQRKLKKLNVWLGSEYVAGFVSLNLPYDLILGNRGQSLPYWKPAFHISLFDSILVAARRNRIFTVNHF